MELDETKIKEFREARRQEIYKKSRDEKIPYSQLSKTYGISPSRISKICSRVESGKYKRG